MIPIAAAVERIVQGSPLLSEGLALGLLNLSAVARAIQPQVASETLKPAGEGAIVMALKRLAPRLVVPAGDAKGMVRQIRDITVRSNICEFTYLNSLTVADCQRRLLEEAGRAGDAFLAVTQGVHEVTVLAAGGLEKRVDAIFEGERRVSRLAGLAAVGIRYTPKVVGMPGVYYAILKQLLWAGINVVEVVSTYTELTLILEKRHVDRAFTVLKRFLWP
jgi:hypothetical protein